MLSIATIYIVPEYRISRNCCTAPYGVRKH